MQWKLLVLVLLSLLLVMIVETYFGPLAAFVALIVLIIFTVVLTLVIYFKLAPQNYFFTFVPEASVKIVVKGDQFEKALIQLERHTLDNDWNVVPEKTYVKDGQTTITVTEDDEEKTLEVTRKLGGKKYKESWHLLGGLRFYGLWPIKAIYAYYFRWTGVKETGEVDHHSKEKLDFITLKDDIYWCQVENAEDKDLLPLSVELLLRIRIRNPYKALFKVENWLEMVINRIKPSIRDYVASTKYENLIKEQLSLGNKIRDEVLKDIIIGLRQDYGVEVRNVEVKNIDPPEHYREAGLQLYLAEREKEREVIKAEAEKIRVTTVYEAIIAQGLVGEKIRLAEALEKATGEGGAKVIFSFDEWSRILASAFPDKSSEQVKEILEELKKAAQIISES